MSHPRRCGGSQLTCNRHRGRRRSSLRCWRVWLPARSCWWCPGAGTRSTRCRTTGVGRRPEPPAQRGPAVPGGAGGGKVGNPQCSDGIDNDGDGKIDYADPECVGGAGQRRELVRDRHPRRQRRRLQAGLLLRRQLGHGRRRLHVAAQVRSADDERGVPVRPGVRHPARDECSLSSSQSQTCVDKCQKLVPNGCDCFGCCAVPGASTPIRLVATCTAKDFGDPDEVPALHAGHAVHDPVRALRLLHRQGDAARRLHAPTAARPTTARPATSRADSTASTRRCARPTRPA